MTRSAKTVAIFAGVLIVIGVLGVAAYINTQRLVESQKWVVHTHEVLENLGDILSVMKDAETGQRGYIITGQDNYLQPYNQAMGLIDSRLNRLGELTKDDPRQQPDLVRLRALAQEKLAWMRQAIDIRGRSGLEAAVAFTATGQGEKAMDDIRALIDQMQKRERDLLQSRQQAASVRTFWTLGTMSLVIPLSLVVLAVAALILLRTGGAGHVAYEIPSARATCASVAARYAFAALCVVLAVLLRFWLVRLGPMPLFITFYPAVLLTAVLFGGGPGIFATFLSGLATDYWFIPPLGFAIESPADVVALVFFLGNNLALCIVVERMRRMRWAEAFGVAKEQEARELAAKNELLARQSAELSQALEAAGPLGGDGAGYGSPHHPLE